MVVSDLLKQTVAVGFVELKARQSQEPVKILCPDLISFLADW